MNYACYQETKDPDKIPSTMHLTPQVFILFYNGSNRSNLMSRQFVRHTHSPNHEYV